MKKIIKAHKGFAHVPQPSSQQAPSKAKGTAGTTPRRRRIGLPQRFRGGRGRAPMPQAPPTVRPTRAMPEPAVIQQPKPVVRPPKIMDGDGGRGGKPIQVQRPKPQSFRVPAVQMPKSIPKPMQPRIVNKGGYISKTKYGQVNNLKGK